MAKAKSMSCELTGSDLFVGMRAAEQFCFMVSEERNRKKKNDIKNEDNEKTHLFGPYDFFVLTRLAPVFVINISLMGRKVWVVSVECTSCLLVQLMPRRSRLCSNPSIVLHKRHVGSQE